MDKCYCLRNLSCPGMVGLFLHLLKGICENVSYYLREILRRALERRTNKSCCLSIPNQALILHIYVIICYVFLLYFQLEMNLNATGFQQARGISGLLESGCSWASPLHVCLFLCHAPSTAPEVPLLWCREWVVWESAWTHAIFITG